MPGPTNSLLRVTLALLFALTTAVLGTACAKAEPKPSVSTPEQAKPTPLLTDAQVRAKYQHCPGGWYAGPRPGKARFTKDTFLWTVTPAFAERYCMPEAFVSTELKGAEAVAFKLRRDTDEVNCGFGGNPNACGGQLSLRFEVYIKSDVKLPKDPGFVDNYFQAVRLPSSILITKSHTEWNESLKIRREQNRGKVFMPFPGNHVGLDGMKGDVVAWPIAAMYLQTYYGSMLQGIDYYAFDASVGFLNNPGVKQSGVEWFAVNFNEPNIARKHNQRTTEGLRVSDFDHAIVLPRSFMDIVIEVDRTRQGDLEQLIDKAFKRP